VGYCPKPRVRSGAGSRPRELLRHARGPALHLARLQRSPRHRPHLRALDRAEPRRAKGDDCTAPAWDIVASGRLPALTSLSVEGKGLLWGQGHNRLARALEAVGGTLKRLSLIGGDQAKHLPAGPAYELGAAVGKLRRLNTCGSSCPVMVEITTSWGKGWPPRGVAQSSSRWCWTGSRRTPIS
jgi:hypothetical protein